MNRRYQELDSIKGIATILMVYFHHRYFCYLRNPLSNKLTDLDMCVSKISHTVFLILLGINYFISYKKSRSFEMFKQKIKKRIYTYISVSLFITVTSFFLYPGRFIIFGVFHFIAAALAVMVFFVGSIKKILSGIAATLVMAAVFERTEKQTENVFMKYIYRALGLDLNFEAIDHFPLVPYFVFPLTGLLIGHLNYSRNRSENKQNKKKTIYDIILTEIGKKSFYIYVIHYIVMIAMKTY